MMSSLIILSSRSDPARDIHVWIRIKIHMLHLVNALEMVFRKKSSFQDRKL